uniref:FACT complex subunit SSRP1 isoform X1 n=2 Tax=Myxine glutinosa TaxID=7769 RepID=UPI00358EAF68
MPSCAAINCTNRLVKGSGKTFHRMVDVLEYSDICQEVKGAMNEGRLKLSGQSVLFKSSRTGRVENVPGADLAAGTWRRVARGHGLLLRTRSGVVHKFDGFKEGEFEKLANFFKTNYGMELVERENCVKGWNWGTVNFSGQLMTFSVGDQSAFEVPLGNVSQCTTGKNEVMLEFHQNDDAAVSLLEVRFFVPPGQDASNDPVEAMSRAVLSQADVIQATGDALCVFPELQCLTPRGRYDIRLYPSFLHLHGKTFDYKIPYATVLRLFLLPHKDHRQMFFVVSLDPPIKQGQTRYHFLILLFAKDEVDTISLSMPEDEVKERFEGKLSQEMSGPIYELVSRVMKALVNRKITVPGSFTGHSSASCITCSYRAGSGLLYPLERGFVYVHKPPVHVRFDEIAFVNFARGTTTTRSFDFEIETKQGNVFTFSSIEREEYGHLFDFVNNKKLNIKNRGLKETAPQYEEELEDSDDDSHDVYLQRMKEEGRTRAEAGSGSESDESFNPGEEEDDVAEEYDSSAGSSGSESSGEEENKEKEEGGKESKPKKAKRTKKPAGESSGSAVKKRKIDKSKKKDKDPLRPKRPLTPYLLWLNATREELKREHPGIAPTDLLRRAGEAWKALSSSAKIEWEQKAEEGKKEYARAMEVYNTTGGEEKKVEKKKAEAKPTTKKGTGSDGASSRTTQKTPQSKEFVSSGNSSSEEEEEDDNEDEEKVAEKGSEKEVSSPASSESE